MNVLRSIVVAVALMLPFGSAHAAGRTIVDVAAASRIGESPY